MAWKPVRERNPVAVAIIGLIVIALMAAVAYRADDLPVIGGGTTYSAYFSEAAGIQSGDEVRIAGAKVGKVTGVALAGTRVRVEFRVKDVWVGNASTLSIMIKTLLGAKYMALDPLGSYKQNPEETIPVNRTVAPYDVTTAFDDLTKTTSQLDTAKVAESLEVISDTFSGTPPHVRKALTGLSALSKVISSRDAQLKRLLAGTKDLSGTLASQNTSFEKLLTDGNKLLAELRKRRWAIHGLLTGTNSLAIELRGLVNDNDVELARTLKSLDSVTSVLRDNQSNLDRALKLSGPYMRLVGNTVGNGRWVDGYLCGVVPRKPVDYLEGGDWKPPPHVKSCIPTEKGGR